LFQFVVEKVVSYLGCICFLESVFREITFQTFLCLFAIRKVVNVKHFLVNEKHFPVNRKHFPIKGKFGLISKKVFSFYFAQKTLSRSCEKFSNIILFADYVKFNPQTFDCYIFCLNLFFSISSLKI
jgi:hypothetical protein